MHPARYQWSSAATGQGWIVGWVQALPVFPQRQHWAGDSSYALLMTPVGVAGTVFIQLRNKVELPEPWASSASTGAVTSLRAHCPCPVRLCALLVLVSSPDFPENPRDGWKTVAGYPALVSYLPRAGRGSCPHPFVNGRGLTFQGTDLMRSVKG